MKKLILIIFVLMSFALSAQVTITDAGNSIDILHGVETVKSMDKDGLSTITDGTNEIDFWQGGKPIWKIYYDAVDSPSTSNISDLMDTIAGYIANAGYFLATGLILNSDTVTDWDIFVDTATAQNIEGYKTFKDSTTFEANIKGANLTLVSLDNDASADSVITIEGGILKKTAFSVIIDTSKVLFLYDTIRGTASAKIGTKYDVDTLTASVYDSLAYHLDTTQSHNTRINANLPLTGGTLSGNLISTEFGNSAQQTITLGTGVTTFAVTSNVIQVTGDGAANTVATITGAIAGIYTFIFVDGLVTISNNDGGGANTVDLDGANDFISADDKTLMLVFDGTSWYKLSESTN